MSSITSNNPLVSIIMNCRNGQQYLRQALDSVFAQSYANWEIIFWDNASTDDSGVIARSYGQKLRYFRNETAVTLGRARNLAIAQVRGQYLSFLDCDDKWFTRKLQKQVELLEDKKDIDFIYTNYFRLIMPETDNLILGLKGRQSEGDVFGRFLYEYPVNLQTVMLRMDALNSLQLKFDDNFEVSEEYDFFMRFLFKSKALYIDEPFAIYRIHQNASSVRFSDRYPVEMQDTLNKLKNMDISIMQKYAPQIKYYEAKLGYWYAKVSMESGDSCLARTRLAPYKFVNPKFFLLYLVTFLPVEVWKILHHYKSQGKL